MSKMPAKTTEIATLLYEFSVKDDSKTTESATIPQKFCVKDASKTTEIATLSQDLVPKMPAKLLNLHNIHTSKEMKQDVYLGQLVACN